MRLAGDVRKICDVPTGICKILPLTRAYSRGGIGVGAGRLIHYVTT